MALRLDIIMLLSLASLGQTQAQSAASAVTADQMRLLDVEINGHSSGKIGQFTLRDGSLLTTRGELHELGILGPTALIPRSSSAQGTPSDEMIALSDLPGLRWRLDQETQILYMTATNDVLVPSILGDEARKIGPPRRTIQSGSGITLNYDVAGTAAGRQLGSSSLLDVRAFSPWGVVSSGLLTFAGSGQSGSNAAPGSAANRIVRLDSAYTFADVNTLRRYSFGDFITGGLSWTRPVRLTGVQVRSDFSMRPDLITFPLPSITGSAAVPSTVDVLANGNLVLSRQVDAGPFEIPQLPVMNGANGISMTVTNALGQQVTVTQPFYASVSLLAPGLQTFSAQGGLVRREWGIVSNNYGKLAGVGDYRRGLNNTVTVEASAEGTPGASMAGGGAVVRVGNLGIFNAAMAASVGSGVKGSQGTLGFQRTGTRFSVGASEMISTRGFQDVAAINGDPVPRRQLSANGGIFLKRLGTLGAAYAEVRQDASLHALYQVPAAAQNTRIVSASYAVQFHHMSLYANEFRNLVSNGGKGSQNGLQVGVTVPMGRRKSVDLSEGTGEGYGEIRMQKSAAEIGEWGYDTYLNAMHPVHEFAQLQFKSPWGLFTGGIDQDGNTNTLRAEFQGAISFVDRAFFLSNTIYDSFAIVDTNGLPDVRVLQENRDVGSTDSKGRLLVPDMRAFDLNHLDINPTDVPLDTSIDTTMREIRPQDRSGVVVRFPVKISHGALLRMVDDAGVPLPVGSTATLRATGTPFPIGYEGEVYVENLGPYNDVEAELPNGHRCGAAFTYLPVKGIIPTIGPLHCHGAQP